MIGALLLSSAAGGGAGWVTLGGLGGLGEGFVFSAFKVLVASAVTFGVHLALASLLSPPLRQTARRLLRR
ncbi:MAG: hypothetical protein Q9Q13_06485 [Acidobacteriota bacterium]|nr:hypothetical protein [Acidobacteriota bacterium]